MTKPLLYRVTNIGAEIALRPFQVCNLVEINGALINNQDDLNNAAKAASFIATLQAGYTDFHYLREIWRETTEKDALLGVSITGLANTNLLSLDFNEASAEVFDINSRISALIGINIAARQTTVKPAGTTSLVLGTSSGIHSYHSKYYIRRIRLTNGEAITDYLKGYHPELLEEDTLNKDNWILSVPQKAPEGAITRDETAIDLLERVKMIYTDWIKPGHYDGDNTHNVSCTVSVRDDEWDTVRDWMWVNKDYYTGISVLPYDVGSYTQAPFETIDKSKYEEMVKHLHNIDLTKIVEIEDGTDQKGEIACGGGSCEIT